MNTINKIISIALLTFTINSYTHAMPQGPYVGGGIGGSILNNFSDTSKKNDGLQFAGRIFAGVNLMEWLGLELSYAKYGETEYTLDDTYDSVTFNYHLNTTSLVAKGYFPLDKEKKWNFYGLFGVAYVNANADMLFFDTKIANESSHAYSPTVGIGATYTFNQHLLTNIEYSYVNGKDGNSSHIAIPDSNLLTWNIAVVF